MKTESNWTLESFPNVNCACSLCPHTHSSMDAVGTWLACDNHTIIDQDNCCSHSFCFCSSHHGGKKKKAVPGSKCDQRDKLMLEKAKQKVKCDQTTDFMTNVMAPLAQKKKQTNKQKGLAIIHSQKHPRYARVPAPVTYAS